MQLLPRDPSEDARVLTALVSLVQSYGGLFPLMQRGVGGVFWGLRSDSAGVHWQEDTTYNSFNVYRGVLSVLLATGNYTQFPDIPGAARFCGLASGPLNDTFTPPAGEGAFYLVTGFDGSAESSLGDGRPNTRPC